MLRYKVKVILHIRYVMLTFIVKVMFTAFGSFFKLKSTRPLSPDHGFASRLPKVSAGARPHPLGSAGGASDTRMAPTSARVGTKDGPRRLQVVESSDKPGRSSSKASSSSSSNEFKLRRDDIYRCKPLWKLLRWKNLKSVIYGI